MNAKRYMHIIEASHFIVNHIMFFLFVVILKQQDRSCLIKWNVSLSYKILLVIINIPVLLQWDPATSWTSHGGGVSISTMAGGDTSSYRAQTSHDKRHERREDDHRQTVSNKLARFTNKSIYRWLKIIYRKRKKGSKSRSCFKPCTSNGKDSEEFWAATTWCCNKLAGRLFSQPVSCLLMIYLWLGEFMLTLRMFVWAVNETQRESTPLPKCFRQ